MTTGVDYPIEIRAAAVGDAGLLAQLGRATFVEAFETSIESSNLIAFADKRFGLQQQLIELSQPGTRVFVAWHRGRAVGYAQLCESDSPACIESAPTIELGRLYLYAQWQRRGIGKALLEACLNAARQTARRGIWLDVWDQNVSAQDFYRKHRFRLAGHRPYVVGNAVQRHLLMHREL